MRMVLALGFLLALAAPAAALPACGVSLSAAEQAQVKGGEIVVRLEETARATMRDVVCVGFVEAPAAAVYRVITDYEHYEKIFPNVIKNETRMRRGNVVHNYSELDYPWPLPDKWTLNEITHDPARYQIRFHRIAGSTKEIDGTWSLFPEGRHTLVVYRVRVDPGLPLVPQWAIEWGASRVAPEIIQGVRKWLKT